MFEKAIKHEAKLRLAIAGPSGSGKTYTGLLIAQGLVNGGKIAVVDTEHGSASKYADLFDFDVMEMFPPFHPDRFVQAIRDAQEAGYSAIILDSLSHEWSGTGGILDEVDKIAQRSNSKNTFAAWKEGTPLQNKLVDTIIGCDIHVIATMRTKQDYIVEINPKTGKNEPKKVGLAPVQREGFEYEFDVVMNMDNDNQGVIVKTRCPDLQGGVFKKPGKDVSDILVNWLTGSPRPKAAPLPREQSKAQTGERIWSVAQKNVLIENKLAANDFAARGMLGLSNLPADATEAEILNWGQIYRDARPDPKAKDAISSELAAAHANSLTEGRS